MMSISSGFYRQFAMERVLHGSPFDTLLAAELEAGGHEKVLLLTAPQAVGTPDLARLETAIGNRLAGTFSGLAPHTPLEGVLKAADLARKLGADHLVALGGGSVIDAAKLIALCVHEGIDAPEGLLNKYPTAGVDPSRRPSSAGGWIRMTALPMTLSAAEFTWFAGVTDTAKGLKYVVGHPMMMAQTVIMDPALTLGMGATDFLASGIRAVDHAAERLAALTSHPFNDAVCRQALQMLSAYLPRIHKDPRDLEARQQSQMAGWLSQAGAGTGVRVGASHALGHVLGAHAGIPHGLTSCLLLPAVMTWNAGVNAERQALVSAALGADDIPAAEAIRRLVAAIELPTRLRDVGIIRDDLALIAAKSFHDPGLRNNPRPVETTADVQEILELAW
ncbi:maleylacetate reductase [Labrys okinawensis]|uniref:Maleylacetate reductase n=1 Tax=Labrys okinawensis TaxID=346911 RepID=A0A2S9QJX9_9HYPH|nr:iron-containing alcohol dehydrogenase [Labrys okinawensis]PRH89645.1 maleylacetate reductase [Labrys okinawensis]